MRGGLITTGLGLLACGLFTAGCGVRLDGGGQLTPDGSTPSTDGRSDPSIDAPPMLGPWGAPAAVLGASTATGGEDDATLSSSTNEMIFAIADAAAGNTKDLWYMSRPSPTGAWSMPTKLPFNVTGVSDETPRLSPDNLTLYFASARTGGPGLLDIYKVTRPSIGGAWGTPSLVPGVSTANNDKWFVPCAVDNTYMVSVNNDVGQGTLGSQPTVCAELSSTAAETGPFLSPDCKTIYFASVRSGTNKIYRATRPTLTAPFSAPELVTDFDALGGAQEDPWLSTDLRTFVLVSDKNGSKDVYISTR